MSTTTLTSSKSPNQKQGYPDVSIGGFIKEALVKIGSKVADDVGEKVAENVGEFCGRVF